MNDKLTELYLLHAPYYGWQSLAVPYHVDGKYECLVCGEMHDSQDMIGLTGASFSSLCDLKKNVISIPNEYFHTSQPTIPVSPSSLRGVDSIDLDSSSGGVSHTDVLLIMCTACHNRHSVTVCCTHTMIANRSSPFMYKYCHACFGLDVADMDVYMYTDVPDRIPHFTCDLCGYVKLGRSHSRHTVNGHSFNFCMECSHHIIHCESCGETCMSAHAERIYARIQEDIGINISPYIAQGYCSRCGKNSIVINEYYYKPKPQFLKHGDEKTELFFGVELEVEVDEDDDSEDLLIDLARSVRDDKLYIKHDGSLCHGFEIVSHPFSYKWFQQNYAYWMDKLEIRHNGAKSYDTSTCGMHVHMSLAAFGSLHLYKFLKMWYDNPDFTVWVSRRNIHSLKRWAGFDNVDDASITYKAKYKNGYERHVAVNVSSANNTAEVRIFKGTLSPAAFFSNIECCKAMYDYTQQATLNPTVPEFIKYVQLNRKMYPHFIHFVENEAHKYKKGSLCA